MSTDTKKKIVATIQFFASLSEIASDISLLRETANDRQGSLCALVFELIAQEREIEESRIRKRFFTLYGRP